MRIMRIDWDKVYLILTFDQEVTEPIYLKGPSSQLSQIREEFISDHQLRLPITYPFEDKMLPEGSFHVYYQNSSLKIDVQAARELDDKSRVFFYSGTTYAYVVHFSISRARVLSIQTNYMMKNKKPDHHRPFLETKSRKQRIKKLATVYAHHVMQVIYNVLRAVYPKKGNNILLMSESRVPISGNLKALDDRIKERNLPYHVRYFFVKSRALRSTIKNHFKLILQLAKADYIFVDDYAPIFTEIDLKKAKLIQVWHAGVGFKSVGYSRFGKPASPWPARCAHRKYDYMSVASPNLIPVYQELTGLQKEHFLVTGMPRLDGYLDPKRIEETRKKLYDAYPNAVGKRVILFAPTFRGANEQKAFYNYKLIKQKKLYDICKEHNYYVLFKFHPFIRKKMKIKKSFSDAFQNASKYPDINELFYITDILITDYSSNIYEYSLFEKPIIFFDYDMEEYALIRGVHQNLEESPGNVCRTFDELLNLLISEDFDIEKVRQFKKTNFAYTDSGSCDRLIDAVLPLATKKS